MKYNLTVHYKYDPDDYRGYEDEIEAGNIELARKQVEELEDFDEFNYYILESEDGSEYYNMSEEPDFVDEC